MLDFHRELLDDAERTLAFRDAIRATVKPGDVVVDLGSGSGILSFFAIEAGAARVYAIEKQHMADVAALLARHNGYADRVTFLHEHSLEATLPERANVLVTETLGMLGLDEQILSATIDARSRFLLPGAAIIPARVALSAVPVELPYDHQRLVGWWSEPRHGLDLAPLRLFASNSQYGAHINEDAYLAAPAPLIDVDLHAIDSVDVTGRTSFTIARDGLCHGFGAWFDASLVADGSIRVTNRIPHKTHWMQAFLPLETPIEVVRGNVVDLELQSRDGRAWRWRGTINSRAFDQLTTLAMPPCSAAKK